MKKLLQCLIIIFFPLIAFCQNAQSVQLLFDGKVMLALPKELKATAIEKGMKPDYLFANKRSTAALMITATEQTISDNDIPAYADSIINEIKKTGNLIDDGISLNDGKNISYIKYSRESGEDKGFNYIFFASMREKLVVFSFNCAARKKGSWEKDIDEMVAALRIKD